MYFLEKKGVVIKLGQIFCKKEKSDYNHNMQIWLLYEQFRKKSLEYKKTELDDLLEKVKWASVYFDEIERLYSQLISISDDTVDILYHTILQLDENVNDLSKEQKLKLFQDTQSVLKKLIEKEKFQKQQDEQEADTLLASL